MNWKGAQLLNKRPHEYSQPNEQLICLVDNTGQSDSIIIYSFSNMIKMGNNKDLRT